MDRAAILLRLTEFFSVHADVNLVTAWLFGSFGRGDARPERDVDVAVLYRRAPALAFNALPRYVSKRKSSAFSGEPP